MSYLSTYHEEIQFNPCNLLIVKSPWITRICTYLFFLTQRRKARKGFYIVNWLYGNRIYSWSSWSVETRKSPAWELLNLWNPLIVKSPANHSYLRVSFFLTQRRKARKGFYIVNWLHGNRNSSWSSWSVETRKSPAFLCLREPEFYSNCSVKCVFNINVRYIRLFFPV